MTAQIYENINGLSYTELLDAIDKMREKIYELGDVADDADFMYYVALVQALDRKQREL